MSGPAVHAAFNPNHLDESMVTRALAEGEHTAVLQAYFGETLHAHLGPLSQRALSAVPDRQSVVYLLPGLLGSRLGASTQRGKDLVWLDPGAVQHGKLMQLTVGRRRSIRPMGMMLPAYLMLKLSLQAAGFQVRSHAYDWRRSIVDLGRQLAEEWVHEPVRDIMAVGHSMGGLVLRAALQHAAGARVSRVIQMGTPNRGSWALMQVLRACYPTVRKLGAVDQHHSAEELARLVFRSFPSFYEMLPRSDESPLHWLDERHWPADTLQPSRERLRRARGLSRYLAEADQRCHAIVGIDQLTACGAAFEHDGFTFDYGRDGDGTVPVSLAQWSGAQHWYVPARHGLMPLHPAIIRAVPELLRNSTTTQLSVQRPTPGGVVQRQRESDMRAALEGKVRWDKLPLNERRELLEPVISADFLRACQQ